MAVVHLEDETRSNAGVVDVESAILGLDGNKHTLVLVELASGRTLTIVGGPDNFVVECAENESVRYCVVQPSKGEALLPLAAGGQLVEYPARLCVDLASALEAGRTFLIQDGARSPQLMWSVET